MAWGYEVVDKNNSADGLGHEIVDQNSSADDFGHEIVDKTLRSGTPDSRFHCGSIVNAAFWHP